MPKKRTESPKVGLNASSSTTGAIHASSANGARRPSSDSSTPPGRVTSSRADPDNSVTPSVSDAIAARLDANVDTIDATPAATPSTVARKRSGRLTTGRVKSAARII